MMFLDGWTKLNEMVQFKWFVHASKYTLNAAIGTRMRYVSRTPLSANPFLSSSTPEKQNRLLHFLAPSFRPHVWVRCCCFFALATCQLPASSNLQEDNHMQSRD